MTSAGIRQRDFLLAHSMEHFAETYDKGKFSQWSCLLLQACYEGVGVAADAQDALLWLGRASKTLLAEDLSVESISNTSTASLLARRIRMQRDRQQGGINHSRAVFNTEVSMPEEQVLAKTALLLGFLHLDGEATKFDAAEALKWFKVALLNDCAEAARIIGTLFNTGQYG